MQNFLADRAGVDMFEGFNWSVLHKYEEIGHEFPLESIFLMQNEVKYLAQQERHKRNSQCLLE